MSKAEELAKKVYPKGDIYIFGDASITCQVAYVKGYRQAEKDLDVVSWVKEVSGVKELSRAKEEALKAYPPQSIAANYDTINRRDAFEYGYLKAEKDLELTWKDIELIVNIDKDTDNEESIIGIRNNEEHYQEVLERFKNLKKGKNYEN